ncbi:DMT family transporter [Lentibacillus saliphilus]|uniref:DMT family transporter n=1 Tax=Lentibacillus saliphilus TaxID=2737028 RepID=UPI001C2F123B|nr:DMT family transporter [Lentibacillus saliphilus]
MNNTMKGIMLLLISAFGFSVMAAFVKLAGDLPSIQKTFFRNLISAIIAFGFVMYNRESLFGKKENQPILLLRAFFGTLGIIFFFYAIDHLVLSDADMLNKMSPFLLIIFSAVFLKEKVMPFQVVTVVIAFIGMLFIIKPAFSVDIIPYLMGFSSAVFAAAAYTFLRVLGNREKYYTVVFYFSFFSTVVLLPFLIVFFEPMTGKQLTFLLLAGVFATLGQFGITLAYKFAPAKDISIFFYSTVLYSTIISIVFFEQVPDIYSFIGYVVILSAMVYMFFRGKKRSPERS